MLRLIMQHEEPSHSIAQQSSTSSVSGTSTLGTAGAVPSTGGATPYRYNGNGHVLPQPNVNPNVLNLNFRVFEIDCPELEAVLKETLREGSNTKRLQLLGIEIVDKPKPPPPPPQPVAAALEPPPQPDPAALKARLLEKHKQQSRRSWLFWFKNGSKNKAAPLPLP